METGLQKRKREREFPIHDLKKKCKSIYKSINLVKLSQIQR